MSGECTSHLWSQGPQEQLIRWGCSLHRPRPRAQMRGRSGSPQTQATTGALRPESPDWHSCFLGGVGVTLGGRCELNTPDMGLGYVQGCSSETQQE